MAESESLAEQLAAAKRQIAVMEKQAAEVAASNRVFSPAVERAAEAVCAKLSPGMSFNSNSLKESFCFFVVYMVGNADEKREGLVSHLTADDKKVQNRLQLNLMSQNIFESLN